MLPGDPVILLSTINTKLRDEYASLAELCAALDVEESDLIEKLRGIGYVYDENLNRFR